MDTASIVMGMVRVRLSAEAPQASQASHASHVGAPHPSPTPQAEPEKKQDDKNKDPVNSNPALPRAGSQGEIMRTSDEEPAETKNIKKPACSTRGRPITRGRGRGRGRPGTRATQNNEQDDNTGDAKEEGETKDMEGGVKTPCRDAKSKAKPSPSPKTHSPKTSSPGPARALKRPAAAPATEAEVPADEPVKKGLWIQFHNMDHPLKLDSLTSEQESMLENGVPHSYIPDPNEVPPKVPRRARAKSQDTENKQKQDTASSPTAPSKRPASKAGGTNVQEYQLNRL